MTNDPLPVTLNSQSSPVDLALWAYERGEEYANLDRWETEEIGPRDVYGTPHGIILTNQRDGSHKIIDLREHRATPDSIRACRDLTDVGSFKAYLARYSTPATTVWLDDKENKAVAILDDHRAAVGDPDDAAVGYPGWGRHRAHLELAPAPEWRAWTSLHRNQVPQVQFAEIIEEFAGTMITPDPEDMLRVAQSIVVNSNGQVSSRVSLRDGAINLVVAEQLEATAGTKETPLEIPQKIAFRARRWVGDTEAVPMTARLRWRVNAGKLTLGIVIDRLDVVEEDHRSRLLALLAETGRAVFTGTP